MSLLNDIFEKITGLDLDGSNSAASAAHPCSNCPSSCVIAGEACSLCEPYKRKLIDAIYHVDHIDEFRDQYEVVSDLQNTSASGTVTCPRCGGPSSNHYVCDYCGAQLSDEPAPSGKIRVSSASEIPNPIMDAQDIIFERYDAIVKKFSKQMTNSGNFLSDFFREVFDTDASDNSDSLLGKKMSEAEIKEAASLYRVSVGDYLTGLDNGKYLTLSGKKNADAQGKSSWTPASSGLEGLAGIGMMASELMRDSFSRHRPQQYVSFGVPQRHHPQHDSHRPDSDPFHRRDFDSTSAPQRHHPEHAPQRPDSDSFHRRDFESTPAAQQTPQRRRPDQEKVRPSDTNRPKPVQNGNDRPSHRSESEHSSRWKERDSSRRRG